jgi:hypothetical protein
MIIKNISDATINVMVGKKEVHITGGMTIDIPDDVAKALIDDYHFIVEDKVEKVTKVEAKVEKVTKVEAKAKAKDAK